MHLQLELEDGKQDKEKYYQRRSRIYKLSYKPLSSFLFQKDIP